MPNNFFLNKMLSKMGIKSKCHIFWQSFKVGRKWYGPYVKIMGESNIFLKKETHKNILEMDLNMWNATYSKG